MAGGGVSSPTDRITSTQFSFGELQAIVEEASAANLHVMAHAYTPRAIVKAGVKSIEHRNLLDDESASIASECGAFVVPTLLTYHMLKKDGLAQGLATDMVKKVDDVLEAGKESVSIAKKHGVRMCFGTDCLSEMRSAQLNQFRLLDEAGLSTKEILQSATCNAAELVGCKGDLGVVAEQAVADLVVLKQNPLISLSVFADWGEMCLAIIQGGNVRYRSGI